MGPVSASDQSRLDTASLADAHRVRSKEQLLVTLVQVLKDDPDRFRQWGDLRHSLVLRVGGDGSVGELLDRIEQTLTDRQQLSLAMLAEFREWTKAEGHDPRSRPQPGRRYPVLRALRDEVDWAIVSRLEHGPFSPEVIVRKDAHISSESGSKLFDGAWGVYTTGIVFLNEDDPNVPVTRHHERAHAFFDVLSAALAEWPDVPYSTDGAPMPSGVDAIVNEAARHVQEECFAYAIKGTFRQLGRETAGGFTELEEGARRCLSMLHKNESEKGLWYLSIIQRKFINGLERLYAIRVLAAADTQHSPETLWRLLTPVHALPSPREAEACSSVAGLSRLEVARSITAEPSQDSVDRALSALSSLSDNLTRWGEDEIDVVIEFSGYLRDMCALASSPVARETAEMIRSAALHIRECNFHGFCAMMREAIFRPDSLYRGDRYLTPEEFVKADETLGLTALAACARSMLPGACFPLFFADVLVLEAKLGKGESRERLLSVLRCVDSETLVRVVFEHDIMGALPSPAEKLRYAPMLLASVERAAVFTGPAVQGALAYDSATRLFLETCNRRLALARETLLGYALRAVDGASLAESESSVRAIQEELHSIRKVAPFAQDELNRVHKALGSALEKIRARRSP